MSITLRNRSRLNLALAIALSITSTIANTQRGVAADCVAAACISVYTQNGQIIIEGRKDASPPVVRIKPRATPTPSVSDYVTPTPTPSKVKTKLIRPARRVPTRTIPKVVSKTVASVSLNDRLIKLLPDGLISKQPESGAVVGVDVIYWSVLPAVFSTRVSVVGEIIDVTMRPAFFWSFGDGSIMVTADSGEPFPGDTISHTYSRLGTYLVVLITTWGGTWVHNGIARTITGEVRKTSIGAVKIANAPTRFKR